MVRMDLALLPSVILAITEQRSLDAVLNTIVEGIARQPDVALARLWLLDPDASCPECQDGAVNGPVSLHLRASAGHPREAGVDWSRTNGRFHRIDTSKPLKISYIATTGESIRILDLAGDRAWLREPEWAQREGLVGFAGRPLIFRGEVLGVLAVFRRTPPNDACWEWLRTLADHAAVAIAHARAYEQIDGLRRELELERDYLREELSEAAPFGDIVGSSASLDRVLRQVEIVAATNANVLIQGESGTGKELIARAIHQRSPRSAKPLIKVNCGSIPKELFESEFFGHVKGSFTGAIRDRVGRFQLADRGTLFLDEVGEIPIELQSKLLRVLQEGEFERVGDEVTRRVDVRVVAATNRDLNQEVAAGRFRLDLYYRLAVFPVEAPPLRDRLQDVPVLAAHFVRQACLRFNLPQPRVTQREMDLLQTYRWPGNVRELQNFVERAVILARGGPLTFGLPLDQAPPVVAAVSNAIMTERDLRMKERANLLAALQSTAGRVSGPGGAAELLGVKPSTLASRVKAFKILDNEWKG
jgi:transcriptional regulator with GAF, ATPase, and Fis domain